MKGAPAPLSTRFDSSAPCRYATPRDKLTVLCGLAAAVAGGTMFPIFTIFLGNLFNALGDPTTDLMTEVRRCVGFQRNIGGVGWAAEW